MINKRAVSPEQWELKEKLHSYNCKQRFSPVQNKSPDRLEPGICPIVGKVGENCKPLGGWALFKIGKRS